jgi:hypothetical protein
MEERRIVRNSLVKCNNDRWQTDATRLADGPGALRDVVLRHRCGRALAAGSDRLG